MRLSASRHRICAFAQHNVTQDGHSPRAHPVASTIPLVGACHRERFQQYEASLFRSSHRKEGERNQTKGPVLLFGIKGSPVLPSLGFRIDYTTSIVGRTRC